MLSISFRDVLLQLDPWLPTSIASRPKKQKKHMLRCSRLILRLDVPSNREPPAKNHHFGPSLIGSPWDVVQWLGAVMFFHKLGCTKTSDRVSSGCHETCPLKPVGMRKYTISGAFFLFGFNSSYIIIWWFPEIGSLASSMYRWYFP